MKLFKLTLAVAMAACFLAGATAQAGEVFQTKAVGAWNSSDTWEWLSGSGDHKDYPKALDDQATIRTTHTVNVVGTNGTARCGTLTINDSASAMLNMQDAGVLEINDVLTINGSGVLRFNDQTEGTAPILRATSSLEINGNIVTTSGAEEGGVMAADEGASVHLVSGTISSQYAPVDILADIEVDGTIEANGYNITFSRAVANGGTITATNGADVTFGSTSTINASSTGLFQATASGSDMTFDMSSDVTITSGANFKVSAGRLDFQRSVSTNGGAQLSANGTIAVAATRTFTASGAY